MLIILLLAPCLFFKKNDKKIPGKRRDSFAGANQQDCIELLEALFGSFPAFLLLLLLFGLMSPNPLDCLSSDEIHEDVNRIRDKPYVPDPEANGR